MSAQSYQNRDRKKREAGTMPLSNEKCLTWNILGKVPVYPTVDSVL